MNETEKTLLQLTGRALFNIQTDFDPIATDWASLYQEVSSQALTILIWNALTEEEHLLVPETVALCWEQETMLHIMKNEQLLCEQQQVLQYLAEAKIPCAILKGSSAAAYYPDPSSRIMGDIDILVKPEQQMEAVDVLQKHGYGDALDENHHCHMTIHKEQYVVEVHREVNGLFLNEKSECVQSLREYFSSALDQRQYVDNLPVLSDEQQAIVLILHKMEHFMTSGLGLRQICDWAVFVKERMNTQLSGGKRCWLAVEPLLKKFGLLTFAGIITKACVEYLYLPGETADWAIDYDNVIAEKVIEKILCEGNFGKKVDRYGERLFANPYSSNRLASFFRVLNEACREHWPVCDKYLVLMPIAPFVLLGRYFVQRKRNERPKLSLIKKYRQSKCDQRLYKELKPFIKD